MAQVTKKYANINERTLLTEFKSQFYILKNKKTVALAYTFIFAFIAFTILLAFSPSQNPSTPYFSNIFTLSSGSRSFASDSKTSVSAFSDESHFSSIFSYFFPNSSHQESNSSKRIGSQNSLFNKGSSNFNNNHTKNEEWDDKVAVLKPNKSTILAPKSSSEVNKNLSDFRNLTQSEELQNKNEVLKGNQTANSSAKSFSEEKNEVKNLTSSLVKKQRNNNGTNNSSGVSEKKKMRDELVKSLVNCDLFDGNWIRDESYPLYKPGSCSLIDEQFNCFLNGRPDTNYQKLKWKPKGCTLPRLDGGHMLELLRGKRLVFVGDSLNRNMWESLICILRNSVKDQRKVYEASGGLQFRTEVFYSFVFEDYKLTVEFFVSPFLVREWEFEDKNGTKKETLRLDLMGECADKYKTADIIIFNTGHWWTHDKTSQGKDYYQEGSHVYKELNVLEAFRKALTTWARWIDASINPSKGLVFFRGYSASHFSGGQWNSGGACDPETEPIKNEKYLSNYPPMLTVLEKIFKNMKTQVSYLNITRMSDYRKDAHPSIYRKKYLSDEERRTAFMLQDCSHWCLPGVPDIWNEILYAQILLNEYQKQQQQLQKRPQRLILHI
ncbi:hypothetical protein ACH5RR_007474 [Cinchona calisaya]|uniref:Trichome birefringence-like N-terminal domain-containing protein n=1 Tax=Cinchona calisaya TaxID=153742 RepID=A0ABD3AS10_9GENT